MSSHFRVGKTSNMAKILCCLFLAGLALQANAFSTSADPPNSFRIPNALNPVHWFKNLPDLNPLHYFPNLNHVNWIPNYIKNICNRFNQDPLGSLKLRFGKCNDTNAHFTMYGAACPRNCLNYKEKRLPYICYILLTPGCICNEGLVKNKAGTCIKEEDCPNEPSEKTGEDRCALKPERGPCDALRKRFYYDQDTKTCKEFFYGGCRGNANNFRDKDECEKACKGH